ncbi:hypothetical protein FJTKL_03503 [Diaporthe vaccinii]|uniref:Uncharacterized protein n=1 Tax=Diaporthe vaccinii TaxID=105482 RepID=A0ABR4F2D4_9PEZI
MEIAADEGKYQGVRSRDDQGARVKWQRALEVVLFDSFFGRIRLPLCLSLCGSMAREIWFIKQSSAPASPVTSYKHTHAVPRDKDPPPLHSMTSSSPLNSSPILSLPLCLSSRFWVQPAHPACPLYHRVFEHAYESCQLGPHMREDHIVPYLLSRPKNNATPCGYLLVCVRVCLRFVVPSVVPLSLALLEGRGLGERGIVRFRQQKIGIVRSVGTGRSRIVSGYVALVVRIRSEILVLKLLSCCRFESMFLTCISNSRSGPRTPTVQNPTQIIPKKSAS